MKVKYNESQEDYLEAILVLSERLPVVRAVDIANYLDFKKSSVSIAMKHLREKEYITTTDSGFISLTDAGAAIASNIYDRHKTLSTILEHLGVDPEIAQQDACKVEHVISEETFQAVKRKAKEGSLL